MPTKPTRQSSGPSANAQPNDPPPKVHVTDRGGRYIDVDELLGSKAVQKEIALMAELPEDPHRQ